MQIYFPHILWEAKFLITLYFCLNYGKIVNLLNITFIFETGVKPGIFERDLENLRK